MDDFTRININVPNDVLQWLDDKARDMGVNRSALILMTIHDYRKQDMAINDLNMFLDMLKTSNENNLIDKDK